MTASVPAAELTRQPGPSPVEQLAGRVARLRTRASGGTLDRWLLIGGGVLLPLGVLLVVLGWLGASHTVLLFEQIPYMISGGMLGLALVFAGGFIYFAYWQTLQVRELRSHNRELTDALGRIESLLAGGAALGAGAGAPLRAPARDSSPPRAATFLATPTGSMLHRPDCPVVAGRDNLRQVSAGADGFEPCKICQPPV